MNGMQGRAGIVTGGASGIGMAITRRLAQSGAHVAIFDRNGASARALASTLTAAGAQASAFEVDVTQLANVQDATHQFTAQAGAPWFLVHAAGWDSPKPFLETTAQEWRTIVEINLFGAFNMHFAVCPLMQAAGGGRVVSIASDSARVGAGGCAVYSACKGGVISYTKSMARELARHGILLNVISPGPTETPLFASAGGDGVDGARWRERISKSIPLGRIGTPEDFTGIVATLLGDGGAYITGQVISVSGGLTMT